MAEIMNPPADDTQLKPGKLEEEKESGASFHCDLYDADVVHQIAQEFLPGLASACVDNTIGGLFRSPASVAVVIRREMVDYLTQRSENFVSESVVLDGTPNEEISDNPHDIISDLVDDFSSSKRNFFSRVSGWLLSERREDRIDDFVQEMEINGFWLLNRRELVAQTLLKNVDFKNMYHCDMSFKSQQELEEHKVNCGFRTMNCSNEGCDSRFSAAQMENHDSTCPFKILKCEQNCEKSLMRREMDRHCITVCPMKLVKCPFHSVGCQSSVPQRTIEQHRSENLSSHLVHVLQVAYKEASVEDLKGRAEELIKISYPPGKLEAARDARSLTHMVKGLEAKLGPLKVTVTMKKTSDDVNDSTEKKEENLASPIKEEGETKKEKHDDPEKKTQQEEFKSPIQAEEDDTKSEKHDDSASAEKKAEEPVKQENLTSPTKAEVDTKREKHDDSASAEKKAEEPVKAEVDTKKEKHDDSASAGKKAEEPVKAEVDTKKEKHDDSASTDKKAEEPVKQENLSSASIKAEVDTKRENHDDSASTEKKAEEPVKQENLSSASINAEVDTKRENNEDSASAEKKIEEPVKQENLTSPIKTEEHIQKEKTANSASAEKVQIEKLSEEKVDEPIKHENLTSTIKVEEPIQKEKHADSGAHEKKEESSTKESTH